MTRPIQQRAKDSSATSGIRARGAHRLEREIKRARRLKLKMQRWIPRSLRRSSITYHGAVLPHPLMREEMCGGKYAVNEQFLDSGCAEARRIVSRLGYENSTHVVEIGSGLGRLATGLLREVGDVAYWGFDPVRPWIDWCKAHIEAAHPSVRFIHIDVENENYNPDGAVSGDEFEFPLPDGHADIVYAWGVFTNMRFEDAGNYISEIARLLRPGGRAFLTAFVEEGVPEETINPSGYVPYPCSAPLHVVRYEKGTLFSVFEKNGLEVEEFAHHGGSEPSQSEIYLRKSQGS